MKRKPLHITAIPPASDAAIWGNEDWRCRLNFVSRFRGSFMLINSFQIRREII
jgi:hypothetical protein